MISLLYSLLSQVAAPVLPYYLRSRVKDGKEDPARLRERQGYSSIARPEGRLVWLHAASVGETMSSLVLIDRILDGDPAVSVLLTTGTVTSAEMAAKRLPPRVIHQYCPLDVPSWVQRFLAHWRPDAAVWIESEIWPNLVRQTDRAGIPMALVNARISARSHRRWRRLGRSFRSLVSCFSVVLCQTDDGAAAFRDLGVSDADCVGNLKFSAPPLPVDSGAMLNLRASIGDRPVWLAASTHPGEEELVLEAHERLRAQIPSILTILVPRHPSRAEEIEALLKRRVAAVSRRTITPTIDETVQIYIADTMGELGLFYALVTVAYVGGGMGRLGGHNPIEPAQQDTAILYGPDRGNFTSVAEELEQAGAARLVYDGPSLAEAVLTLLSDNDECARRVVAARSVADRNQGVVDRVFERLGPVLAETRDAEG